MAKSEIVKLLEFMLPTPAPASPDGIAQSRAGAHTAGGLRAHANGAKQKQG